MMQQLRISRTTHEKRKEELLARVREDGYDGIILFDALNIHYINGMYHEPTERPLVLGLTEDRTEVVVPRLEKEHAETFPCDNVRVYFDYPQGEPMRRVTEMCKSLGLETGQIAVDSDGSPGRNGYVGPELSEVVDAQVRVEDYITDMREVKSEEEITLIREASTWANYAHRLLHEHIQVGKRPVTIGQKVERKATKVMLDTLGDRFHMTGYGTPMLCNFTTGTTTAEPHSVEQDTRIKEGDNIVTWIGPTIGGYTTELERTMVVGEPSNEQRNYFAIMKESQELAIDALEPGVEYRYVEDVVTDYYREQGVDEYVQHHIGHNIGLEGHERPFLDKAYEGELRAGEIFTIEPGFYIPDVGGFRHSDTVLVTDNGTEVLTYYPRDLPELVIPVHN